MRGGGVGLGKVEYLDFRPRRKFDWMREGVEARDTGEVAETY